MAAAGRKIAHGKRTDTNVQIAPLGLTTCDAWQLVNAAAVLKEVTYTWTNPVKDGLVRHAGSSTHTWRQAAMARP